MKIPALDGSRGRPRRDSSLAMPRKRDQARNSRLMQTEREPQAIRNELPKADAGISILNFLPARNEWEEDHGEGKSSSYLGDTRIRNPEVRRKASRPVDPA